MGGEGTKRSLDGIINPWIREILSVYRMQENEVSPRMVLYDKDTWKPEGDKEPPL